MSASLLTCLFLGHLFSCLILSSARRCCGADEFIKLHAYTLTEYHRVVHLDADTLILHPMDELIGEGHRRYFGPFLALSYVLDKTPTIDRDRFPLPLR